MRAVAPAATRKRETHAQAKSGYRIGFVQKARATSRARNGRRDARPSLRSGKVRISHPTPSTAATAGSARPIEALGSNTFTSYAPASNAAGAERDTAPETVPRR